jgi:uncharacterized protein
MEPAVYEFADGEKDHRTWSPQSLVLYFVCAYVFSLLLWLPALARANRSTLFFALGMFGPTLAAFVVQRFLAGNWKAVRLWSTLPEFLIGLFAGGSTILMAAFAAALLMTKSGFSRYRWSTLLQILTLFAPNLLGGPLGEEAGWRGFAISRMQLRFNPVVSALIVGILWANWHIPLILTHVYNVTWWQFLLLTMAASVLLSFGFNASGGSTICSIFLHGLYNVGTGVILNDVIGSADLRSNPVQHNILWIAYGGVAALLCLVTKGRLGYRRPSQRLH